MGEVHDIDFVLADADGFDEDDVIAHGVKYQAGVMGGAGQAACLASRTERADEDAGVERVAAHADAVAKDRAAGEGAGWIDGDDGDALAALAPFGDEGVGEGGFACAGRAGDADQLGAAGVRVDGRQHLCHARVAVVQPADGSCPRRDFSGEEAVGYVSRALPHQAASSARRCAHQLSR